MVSNYTKHKSSTKGESEWEFSYNVLLNPNNYVNKQTDNGSEMKEIKFLNFHNFSFVWRAQHALFE